MKILSCIMGHHHHHHHHHQEKGADSWNALRIALVLNAGFLVVEATVGWITGSLALLSDAVHMLGDVGALLVALGAARLSRVPAAPNRTFGLVRAEVMGGLFNGVTQVLAAAWIVMEALERLSDGPPPVPGWPILVVGSIGLAINLGSVWVLARSGSDDLNIRGAMIHMLADALGSVGAIVAAVFVLYGVPAADPMVSLLVAAMVLVGTWSILRDATRVLLQLPPAGFDVDEMRRALAALDGIESVHDVHVWSLDGREPVVTAHLVADVESNLGIVRRGATSILHDRFSVAHSTVQVEHGDEGCHSQDCGVSAEPRA